jgi:hypothetical protein
MGQSDEELLTACVLLHKISCVVTLRNCDAPASAPSVAGPSAAECSIGAKLRPREEGRSSAETVASKEAADYRETTESRKAAGTAHARC